MNDRSRRRWPWWVLAVLFVGVPILEIYLIVQLGQAVGPWWTILILVADGVLGSWLVKHEGARAWRALQEALESGRMPAKELADGALILVGGTLLIAPGFVSDAVGLFCILPFTRPLARAALARVIARRLTVVPVGRSSASFRTEPGSGPGPDTARPRSRTTAPGAGDVVRGEVVDDDRP
jgi:UPF0716 protein FxsA